MSSQRSRRGGLLAAAVAAGLSLGTAGPVSAQADGDQTTVESLTVELRAGAVHVSGVATFGPVRGVVGTDAAGDAVAPGIGADLTEAAVTARRTPEGDVLTFTLGVADQPAELNGVPELLEYLWQVRVIGWHGTSHYLCLRAFRSAQGARPGDPGPIFLLHEGLQCSRPWRANDAMFLMDGENVTGRMAGGVVEFDVPADRVDVNPDEIAPSKIRWTGSIATRPVLPYPPLGPTQVVDAVDGESPGLALPDAEVSAGMAPVGTPVESVPLSVDGTPELDGSFAMSLPAADEAPGDYTVVVRACYGDNCGIGTETVTIL